MFSFFKKSFLMGIFILAFLFLSNNSFYSLAADPANLKESISQKNQELQKINAQIEETQKILDETKKEGKTLKEAVNKTDKQIKQINLGIQSSEILIKKTELEINSVQNDLSEIDEKIETGREALGETLREMQKKENETPLIIFLKNKSLSDSAFEIQGLSNLNSNLSNEIAKMKILKDEKNEKLNELSRKKQSKELENVNLKNKKIISEEIKKEKQSLLEQTKNQEKIYQKQLSELEKLQDEISDEINLLEEELRLKIDPALLPTPRPGVLGIPIQELFRFTSNYGYRKNPITKKVAWHNGVDFGAPIGTPILAAEKGEVIAFGDQDNYRINGKRTCYRAAYGKFIMVKHENNLTTMYAHLSLWSVKIGDQVEKGQIIGYSGNTGRSTGPHLHFVVYATQTIPPAVPGFYEGTRSSRVCGPLPVGGDLDPTKYLDL